MNGLYARSICICIAASPCFAQLAKPLHLKLDVSPSSWVQVGETITLQATTGVTGALYQFSVTPPNAEFYVLRDFARNADQVEWTPLSEGWHVIRVVAVDPASGDRVPVETGIQVLSRIGPDHKVVVSTTANPLVFLFSAPPCSGGVIAAHFVKSGESTGQDTPPQICDGLTSHNFWIAGLDADSAYQVHARVLKAGGQITEGGAVTFHTGSIEPQLRLGEVKAWNAAQIDFSAGILLESQILGNGGAGAFPIARRLDGPVIWYYDQERHGPLQNMLRPVQGGTLFVVPGYSADAPAAFREIDLAGNLVRETNVDAISERLAAVGASPITTFHHDAVRLPNGNILALAQSQKFLPGENPGDPDRNVLGDMILLLNARFDVLWVWDAFDKLDVNRKAILGEVLLSSGPADPSAEDWTHGNSIEYLADGDILFSIRHQDWVVKIDFRDGGGSGDVVWRLGLDGDFKLDSEDPYPWFSHQHNAHFDGTRLWLFDNGDTRRQVLGDSTNSRGQVYVLDESSRTARLELNADLGQYSTALGSAQRLSNGNYHFLSGLIIGSGRALSDAFSQSLEVSTSGSIEYNFQVVGPTYRSFRMRDLYNAPR